MGLQALVSFCSERIIRSGIVNGIIPGGFSLHGCMPFQMRKIVKLINIHLGKSQGVLSMNACVSLNRCKVNGCLTPKI